MKVLFRTLVLCGALLGAQSSILAHPADPLHDHSKVDQLKLENLLASPLEGVEGIEVVVSRVSIPPHTQLPKHWHPGEEFAYVIDGSVTLWQKGKPDMRFGKGDVAKVPLKQIHTAVTGDEGVVLMIFRVHEQGQPERVPAE